MHIVRIMLKEECLNVVARLKHSKASSHSVLCAYFTSGRCTLNRVYCTLCTLPLIIYYYLCKGYNLKYRYTETQFLECPISSIVPLSRPGFHTFADKVNRSWCNEHKGEGCRQGPRNPLISFIQIAVHFSLSCEVGEGAHPQELHRHTCAAQAVLLSAAAAAGHPIKVSATEVLVQRNSPLGDVMNALNMQGDSQI